MPGFSTQQVSLVLIAILFAVVGIGVGVESRLRPARRRIRLAGVGPLSRVTHAVISLTCLGVAYHVAAYALHWPLRAPSRVVVGVAVAAVLGSIAIDAIEARADRSAGPPDAEP